MAQVGAAKVRHPTSERDNVAFTRRTAPRWPPGQKNLSSREGLTPPRRKGGVSSLPLPLQGREGTPIWCLVPGAWGLGPGAWGLEPGTWWSLLGHQCDVKVDSRWKWRLCYVGCAVANSVSFVFFSLAKENLSFPVGKAKVLPPVGKEEETAWASVIDVQQCTSHVKVAMCRRREVCDRAWCGIGCVASKM